MLLPVGEGSFDFLPSLPSLPLLFLLGLSAFSVFEVYEYIYIYIYILVGFVEPWIIRVPDEGPGRIVSFNGARG